jgi:serine/threonine-protein kinase RsbW
LLKADLLAEVMRKAGIKALSKMFHILLAAIAVTMMRIGVWVRVMKRTDQIREIVLSIPSEDRYLYLLNLVVCYVARNMGFGEEDVEHICLAVIEAGTNAIMHGNKSDPEKTVRLRVLVAEDNLAILVKDWGPGFDLKSVQDPLRPENLMKPTGRGVFLMRVLMDEVEYDMGEGSGTEVRLVKYRTVSKHKCPDHVLRPASAMSNTYLS